MTTRNVVVDITTGMASVVMVPAGACKPVHVKIMAAIGDVYSLKVHLYVAKDLAERLQVTCECMLSITVLSFFFKGQHFSEKVIARRLYITSVTTIPHSMFVATWYQLVPVFANVAF